jgi:hypothetical protein
MAKRATDPPAQSESTGQGTLPKRSFRLWSLLACAVVGLAVAGGATSTQAGNGEPRDGEGYFQPPTCVTGSAEITIDCDDRFNSDIGSCRMRGPTGDQGLAVKACRDGRLAGEGFLERDVTIQATAFGQIICGQQGTSGDDFCLVCETFTTSAGGARRCVQINGQLTGQGTCGPFNVIPDTTGMCDSEIGELQETFSDPQLGFFIKIEASDAGDPAGGAGNPVGKDLVLCGSRSWSCIDNPPNNLQPPLATGAVQGGAGEAIIYTPACFVRSGRTYCY